MGRFAAAWQAFWAILGSEEARQRWVMQPEHHLSQGTEEAGKPAAAVPSESAFPHGDAVYTLVMLQREGRLVDFLQEDISPYTDVQVGAAVRQIHSGCAKVLEQCFGVEPIRTEREGERVELPDDFDPCQVRLTGNAGGNLPYSGLLKHRGWRVTKVDFPLRHAKLDAAVVCPADVEV